MKKQFTVCLIAWIFMFISGNSHAQNQLANRIASAQKDQLVMPISLFEDQNVMSRGPVLVQKEPHTRLIIKQDQLSILKENLSLAGRAAQPVIHEITIPHRGKNLILQLVKTELFTPGFLINYASGEQKSPDDLNAFHLRGIVKGAPNSGVALSLSDDGITASIINDTDHFSLNKIHNTEDNYLLYDNTVATANDDPFCITMDDGVMYAPEHLAPLPISHKGHSLSDITVRIYLEIDHDIVLDKGSPEQAVYFLTGLFNQSALIYQMEGINIALSEIKVWDTPSHYSESGSSNTFLSEFQKASSGFNGDLAHFVNYKVTGGVAAGFEGLCNPDRRKSMCYSGIKSYYEDYSQYSWSVNVFTHEMGHLLGSRHTHACVWNGNGTAIDSCSGFTEGSCEAPGNPPEGGTIMSYCHQAQAGVGMNFSLGFGEQPGNVIRNNILRSHCLQSDNPSPSYCEYRGENSENAYIRQVTMSGIDNISGNNGGYADFTAMIGSASVGRSFNISLFTNEEFDNTNDQVPHWRIWVDWNQDGDFGDDEEEILAARKILSPDVSGEVSVEVPRWAPTGTTRMRVALAKNHYQVICSSFDEGEVEDYTLNITENNSNTCNSPQDLEINSLYATMVDVSWSKIPGAVAYILRLKDRETGKVEKSKIIDGDSNQAQFDNLQFNTSYSLEIKASCNNEYAMPVAFTTPQKGCNQPVNIQVVDNQPGSATLTWNEVTEANYYVVRYKDSQSTLWTIVPVNENKIVLDEFMGTEKVDVSVAAYCSNSGVSGFSPVYTFYPIDCNAQRPLFLSFPIIGAVPTSSHWAAFLYFSDRETKGQIFQYRQTGSTEWQQFILGEDKLFYVNHLTPDTGYEFRVAKVCDSDTSYSTVFTFKTKPEIIATTCIVANDLKVSNVTMDAAEFIWNQNENSGSALIIREAGKQYYTMYLARSGTRLINLKQGTTYEARVASWCPETQDYTTQSAPVFFTTGVCETPDIPEVAALSPGSATITWNDTGAESYTIRYKIQAAAEWNELTGLNNTIQLTGLVPGTEYAVEVRSECETDIYSHYSSRLLFSASYCIPTGNVKVDHAYITTANLSWDEAIGADNYKIKLRIPGESTWNIPSLIEERSHNYIYLTGLRPGTQYEARIEINCDDQSVAYSEPVSFETGIPKCDIVQGLNASEITATSSRLSWELDGYYYMIRVLREDEIVATKFSILNSQVINDLEPATTYTFLVRKLFCNGEISGYSNPYTFTTLDNLNKFDLVGNEVNITLSEKDMAIYPNPANNDISLQFNSANGGTAQMIIYDMKGSQLVNEEISLKKGVNTVKTNIKQLPGKSSYVMAINHQGVLSRAIFLKD